MVVQRIERLDTHLTLPLEVNVVLDLVLHKGHDNIAIVHVDGDHCNDLHTVSLC